jgi:hypothetical protein
MAGHRHLLFVLALLQAGMGLLAAAGQLLFTGANPLYLAAPLGRAALLVTAAAAATAGRRWGPVAVIVLEGLSVFGFWLSGLVGLLPWVDDTVTMTGLLGNVVLPGAMLYLAVRVLAVRVPAVQVPAVQVPAGGVPAATGAPPGRPARTLFLPTEELR